MASDCLLENLLAQVHELVLLVAIGLDAFEQIVVVLDLLLELIALVAQFLAFSSIVCILTNELAQFQKSNLSKM